MTFANSLDQDQARQRVGPDLGPNCLTLVVFLIDKEFFEKFDFEEKKSKDDKKGTKNYPACKFQSGNIDTLKSQFWINVSIDIWSS